MHLIFFDESKPQPDHPFYHIGAISIAEENFEAIEKRVNDLSREVFGEVLLNQKQQNFTRWIYFAVRKHLKINLMY